MDPTPDTVHWLPETLAALSVLGVGAALASYVAVRGVRQRARRDAILVVVVLGLAEWFALLIERAPSLLARAPIVHELVPDDVACMPAEATCAVGDGKRAYLEYASPQLRPDEERCTVPLSATQRVGASKEGALLLYELRAVPPPKRSKRAKAKEPPPPDMRWSLVQERKSPDMRFALNTGRARHPLGVCAVVQDPVTSEALGMTVVGANLAAPPSLRNHGWFIEVMIFILVFTVLTALAVLYLQLRRAAQRTD